MKDRSASGRHAGRRGFRNRDMKTRTPSPRGMAIIGKGFKLRSFINASGSWKTEEIESPLECK